MNIFLKRRQLMTARWAHSIQNWKLQIELPYGIFSQLILTKLSQSARKCSWWNPRACMNPWKIFHSWYNCCQDWLSEIHLYDLCLPKSCKLVNQSINQSINQSLYQSVCYCYFSNVILKHYEQVKQAYIFIIIAWESRRIRLESKQIQRPWYSCMVWCLSSCS